MKITDVKKVDYDKEIAFKALQEQWCIKSSKLCIYALSIK